MASVVSQSEPSSTASGIDRELIRIDLPQDEELELLGFVVVPPPGGLPVVVEPASVE
jgi:hypothetical protein